MAFAKHVVDSPMVWEGTYYGTREFRVSVHQCVTTKHVYLLLTHSKVEVGEDEGVNGGGGQCRLRSSGRVWGMASRYSSLYHKFLCILAQNHSHKHRWLKYMLVKYVCLLGYEFMGGWIGWCWVWSSSVLHLYPRLRLAFATRPHSFIAPPSIIRSMPFLVSWIALILLFLTTGLGWHFFPGDKRQQERFSATRYYVKVGALYGYVPAISIGTSVPFVYHHLHSNLGRSVVGGDLGHMKRGVEEMVLSKPMFSYHKHR